jgi:hypothetical protein
MGGSFSRSHLVLRGMDAFQSPWARSALRVPSGPYLVCRLLELIQGWAFNTSSAPDLVVVIGAENAGRTPANPRTGGASHARASPFHTNYVP